MDSLKFTKLVTVYWYTHSHVHNKYIFKYSTISFNTVLNKTTLKCFIDPGGPLVIIIATESEVAGSNPAVVHGFFESVKFLSMTSFGREVKPWAVAAGPIAQLRNEPPTFFK